MRRGRRMPSLSSARRSTAVGLRRCCTRAWTTRWSCIEEQMAPLVITLGGGSELDKGMTEGGVGRDYLLANGVPYERIVAETQSVDTEQQVRRLAEIARQRHLNSIVVVSDGTHLFRVRKLCQDAGLIVYTSPRGPLGHIDDYDLALRYFHEMLSYTALRLHLEFGWMHGKADA